MMNTIFLQYKDGSWHSDYIPCAFCHNDLDYWIERYQEFNKVEIIDYEIED